MFIVFIDFQHDIAHFGNFLLFLNVRSEMNRCQRFKWPPCLRGWNLLQPLSPKRTILSFPERIRNLSEFVRFLRSDAKQSTVCKFARMHVCMCCSDLLDQTDLVDSFRVQSCFFHCWDTSPVPHAPCLCITVGFSVCNFDLSAMQNNRLGPQGIHTLLASTDF